MVLVDCRFSLADAGAGERAWREAHLPGAVHADLDRDLSDHRQPAALGRHPLPAAGDFCARLARWGISPDTEVVAYDAGDGAMAAARFWWLMRLLGHARVAVLDGGLAAWTAQGLPLESKLPSPAPARYEGAFDLRQVVGTDEVLARLSGSPGWLVDARAGERFRGEVEPLDPVAGHIPGAVNRPYTANLAQGRFKPAEVLAAEFGELLAGRSPETLVLSCGSGVTACHHALAMAQAGLPGARLYAPSWSGWTSDRGRPVATGA
ncbi:MAG TPA: sulfurtransferase [Arenimonas sp.]|nr:sulfurtransferase [Arenimonas sp.]HEU0153327.1 sulfurtransferase [Arenimonas sp.]